MGTNDDWAIICDFEFDAICDGIDCTLDDDKSGNDDCLLNRDVNACDPGGEATDAAAGLAVGAAVVGAAIIGGAAVGAAVGDAVGAAVVGAGVAVGGIEFIDDAFMHVA